LKSDTKKKHKKTGVRVTTIKGWLVNDNPRTKENKSRTLSRSSFSLDCRHFKARNNKSKIKRMFRVYTSPLMVWSQNEVEKARNSTLVVLENLVSQLFDLVWLKISMTNRYSKASARLPQKADIKFEPRLEPEKGNMVASRPKRT
jgi:hypothetical protein